jgi:hypothetical protein
MSASSGSGAPCGSKPTNSCAVVGSPNLAKAFLATLTPAAPVFRMPERQHTIDMFRADVEAAGIQYRDDAGLVADFHALRHTFISNLARSRVHPKAAQSLARHSTITLTMDRYSHTLVGEQAEALNALPDLSASARQDARATGTDGQKIAPDVLASRLAFQGRFSETSIDGGGCDQANGDMDMSVKKNRSSCEESATVAVESSGEGGIQTLGRLASTPVFETGPHQPVDPCRTRLFALSTPP